MKNREWFMRRGALLALLAGLTTALSAENEEPLWKQTLAQIGLLPETDSPYGAGGASHLAEQVGRELTEDELGLLRRDATGKWKEHDDGFLRFELPDDPLFKVESFEPDQKPNLEIVGGAVGSTDNRFQKVYRITFGDGLPYGIIFVSGAEWFDEGICFCGPIDLKTFIHSEGNLIELSQLPDGAIKKSQVINGRHRAILFEWTHSAITQAAYKRIAASMRFKETSPKSREDWIAFSKGKRGFEAGLGWLVPGLTMETALAILGEPTKRDGDTLTYYTEERDEDGGGYGMTRILPFTEGKLVRFAEGWDSYEKLRAPRGSRAWIQDTLRAWSNENGDPFSDEKKAPIEKPQAEIDLILSEFHANAPDAAGDDWDFWCGVLADLKRLEISDRKAVELVEKRSLETDLPHSHTRWILELYESPATQTFVNSRLRLILDYDEGGGPHTGETHNLYASLKRKDPVAESLIREGVSHPNEEIRQTALYFVDKLPKEEARSILKLAMADESSDVRRNAILNVRHVCDKEDIPWLEKVLAQEPTESNRELLAEKIGEL